MKREITALTGLRGLAAWAVVIYHFQLPGVGFGPFNWFIQHGDLAVDLFFVMSGYVLTRSYGALFTPSASCSDYIRFILLRLTRIYPAHFIVLLSYVLLRSTYVLTGRDLPQSRFDWSYVPASLLLAQNWGLSTTLEWNIPAWSISVEFLFYLAFPLLVASTDLVATQLTRLLVSMSAILVLLMLAGLHSGGLTSNIPQFGGLRCLLECALGMLLLHVSRRVTICRWRSIGLMLLSILLALAFATGYAANYVVMPASLFLLLWSLLQPSAPLALLLSTRVLHFLGEISFSTYIVHYLVKDFVKMTVLDRWSDLHVTMLYILLVLLSSVILHYTIERPGQRLGRRLIGRAAAAKSRPVLSPT